MLTAIWGVILAAVAVFVLLLLMGEYRQRAQGYDLDTINALETPSIIYDQNGTEIGRIFVQNRSLVKIDDVPQNFIQALLASEDSRFMTHGGVDVIGTIRALKLTVQGSSQGGSTITQQLARNAYNLKEEAIKRKENTIQRKLVEMFLAMRIEERYSKREILEFYLNRIYFGSGYYGIRSAALGYYGKEPANLETDECASIVTLIKNPYGRSPLINPEANQRGRNYVLGRMEIEGFINKAEMVGLQAKPLRLNPKPLQRRTSQLYERIAREVGRSVGEDALASGGFKIHTTIVAEVQKAAENALVDTLRKAENRPGYAHPRMDQGGKEFLQGAVLMIDHETGGVLAYVGGRDYGQVPYDFIELGRKPSGAAILPMIYAAAFDHGLTPATMVDDEWMDNRSVMIGGSEGVLGEWGMEVDHPVSEGRITARKALEKSKIAASVRIAEQVGIPKIIDTAKRMGISFGDIKPLPRVAVGFDPVSLKDMVKAYSVIPRGGTLLDEDHHFIQKVVSPRGVVYPGHSSRPRSKEAISASTAWQLHSILAGSLYRGSAAGALSGLVEKPFLGGGKGGCSYGFTDAWFLGYNSRVTCGVWTGFLKSTGEIYPAAFSRDLAMPVWQAAMNAASTKIGSGGLKAPADVVEVQICSASGQRATRFCHVYEEDPTTGKVVSHSSAVMEYLRKGTEGLPFCTLHSGATDQGLAKGETLNSGVVLDIDPIRPTEPVVLGEDPYSAEGPDFDNGDGQSSRHWRRTSVLDAIQIDRDEDHIPLPAPKRLEIQLEDIDGTDL